jgi:hypothetical protein
MAWELSPVEPDFFETAPYVFVSTEVVHRPAASVFSAIANDPAGWGRWFPGFADTGRYLTPPPHGPGSRRQVTMTKVTFEETILAWDAPYRWAFTVTKAGAPLAYRMAEDYQVSSHGPYSLVQWTFAVDPRPALGRFMPLGRRVLPRLFRRAMTNLSVALTEAPQ